MVKKRYTALSAIRSFGEKFPNNAELLILGIISLYDLPFKYTGNGTYLIGNKVPDFVSLDNTKVIEVFGHHWHSRKDEERERKDFFKSCGFDTLVIWDDELKARNIQGVASMILKFNKGIIEPEIT